MQNWKNCGACREGLVNATEDNMLLITNDGRKLALDQRMMNELLPDYPDIKSMRVLKGISISVLGAGEEKD